MYDDITHCLTIGRRPDLLRRTLESMGELRQLKTLAINDFGDEETSRVMLEMVPHARIVGPGHHLGHHPAIDVMYREVTTPYIFHNEDDWGFTRTDFLDDARRLLDAEPLITVVCVRATDDMPLTDSDRAKIVTEERAGIRYQRLDALHDQWHGYTFNPHLVRRSMWEGLGGYSNWEKERHLSRHLRKSGHFAAFLLPPACSHIGDGRSTIVRKVTRWKKFKNWVRGVKQIK